MNLPLEVRIEQSKSAIVSYIDKIQNAYDIPSAIMTLIIESALASRKAEELTAITNAISATNDINKEAEE